MVWQLVVSGTKAALQIGEFGVKTINFGGKTPKNMVGKQANWYLDKETKIAKLCLERNGIKNLHNSFSLPKLIKDTLKEDQAVVFLSEDTLFISPYSRGQEYLERTLKKEEVKF